MTKSMHDIDPAALCPGCFRTEYPRGRCAICGFRPSENTHLLALPIGTLLGNVYFIGRILGRPGGFGITYLAWDRMLQMRVAIKEYLPRELAQRDTNSGKVTAYSRADGELFHKGLEQFLQEARLLAQFNHPNIVRVRTYLETNATAYLVMDFIEGRTLDEYVHDHGGRLKENLAVRLLLPVLDGLRALHAKGIVHRDIKPQNIYLAEDKIPVLLDFGAARLILGSHGRSLSVIGTPGFMPPEQYHGTAQQGPWTDVYGLAATLYFLIEGRTYSSSEMNSAEEITRVASSYTRFSRHLGVILQTALASDPAKRFQTAEELLHRLLETTENTVPEDNTLTHEQEESSLISQTSGPEPHRTIAKWAVALWTHVLSSAAFIKASLYRYRRFLIAVPFLLLLLWGIKSYLTSDEVEPPSTQPSLPISDPTTTEEEIVEPPKPPPVRPRPTPAKPQEQRKPAWAPSANAIVEDVLNNDYRFQTGYTSAEVREKLKEIRRNPRVLDETIRRWQQIPLPIFSGRTSEEIKRAIEKRF